MAEVNPWLWVIDQICVRETPRCPRRVSPEGVAFVKKLLQRDPAARPTAAEALQVHP